MRRRALSVAIVVATLLAIGSGGDSAFAGADRHAAMIVDANTGSVLLNEDGDAQRHPASLTKMMTLYLTFETVESGRLTLSDRITISETAASVAPSKLGLDPGEDLSVAEAIKALITKSANDVAVALAERIGGNHANFVRLMNTRARDLGMTSTNFENASGLPDDRQITTARDMITLALKLQDHFPSYYGLFATRAFTFRGKTFRNHNTLLNNFAGIDGIKTGYTRDSGFNLVSSVRRGGRHLIGAVFGGASAATRNGEMRVILTRAMTRASTVKTRKPAPPLIAKLKAPPKLAQRPMEKERPKPQAAQAAAALAAAPKPFAPATAEAPQALDGAATPVEVFKVKRVSVVPRPRAEETTDMVASDTSASSDDAPTSAISAAYEVASASAAPAPVSGIDALLSRDAQLAVTNAVDAAPVTAALAPEPKSTVTATAMPAAAPTSTIQPGDRGMQPSTLQAQAAALSYVPQGVTLRTASLAQQPASARASRFAIQIGAYGSIDEAQRALTTVQSRAGELLRGYASVTHPVQKDGRQFFRARFTGFESARASETCNALRRQSVDCLVMSAE